MLRDFARQCAVSPGLFIVNRTLVNAIAGAVDTSIGNVVKAINACQGSGDAASALRIVDMGFKAPLADVRAEALWNNGSVVQVSRHCCCCS